MASIRELIQDQELIKNNIPGIVQKIEGEKNNQASLSNLDSQSKTSVYKLWMYIPAVLQFFFEEYVLKVFKSDIEAFIEQNANLNDRWWAQEIKKFQYGDTLQFNEDNRRPYYSTIDESKQIIEYVAVNTANGLTTVKVAKEDKSPLNTSELSSAREYKDQVQPAGANIRLISLPSDKLKLPLTVYYDPLLIESQIQPAVEEAINNYLENIPFNGEFSITALQDAVQAVDGVVDVLLGTIQARSDQGNFSTVTRVYYPQGGSYDIDSNFPLSNTITYTTP